MGIIIGLIIGAISGCIAGVIMKSSGGWIRNIILGIVKLMYAFVVYRS